jgi:hypothetical protein
VEYIRTVLARSEDEAIDIIAPALQLYGSAALVIEAYKPLVLEVKKHFCRPGRPRVNPATGERNRTWEEICEEHFHVGIRRMQQILASVRQPRLLGAASPGSRKLPIDRDEFERAKRVAAPATSLAEAVVKEGLAGQFPEALEILSLANIAVPAAQPAAVVPEAEEGRNWKSILTGLVATLELHRDGLPLSVISALRFATESLDDKTKPGTAAQPGTATKRHRVPKSKKGTTTYASALPGRPKEGKGETDGANSEGEGEVLEESSETHEGRSPAVRAMEEVSDGDQRGCNASGETLGCQPPEGDGSGERTPETGERVGETVGDGAGLTPRPRRTVPSFEDDERGTVKPGYVCKYHGVDCRIVEVWDDGTVSLVRFGAGSAVNSNPAPIRELRFIDSPEGRAS